MKYTGTGYAIQATSQKYSTLKYSDCDCQGFVEKVLIDYGVHSSSGKFYNWRGSNHIWRVALQWKGTILEAMEKFGDVPEGALAFIVKNDGGEQKRGYHDSEGNATHVGIYTGQGQVRHSTRTRSQDGVGYNLLQNKSWTHIGLLSCLDYSQNLIPPVDNSSKPVDKPVDNVDNNIVSRLRLIIDELTTLLKDMEG